MSTENDSGKCILYTLQEVCELIGVSPGWLRGQIKAGTSPPVLLVAGQYRFPKLETLKWLKDHKVKTQ